MRFLSGVILMLASASAAAFTLGDARVISTEPEFKAAIPVVDLTENNHETLGGRVRSFSNYSDSLKFSVERASNGQLEFILTSNEPLMTTLALEVEITYGDEQSNREFLLKPLSEETLTVSSTIKPVESDNTKRVERVRTFDLSLTHTTHIVKPNQSLYDIAVDCKEIGGNVYQRALAIFAANKTTFTRGDINKLEQGTQLYIPQQSYVNNFDPTKSRQMFIALAQGNMDLAIWIWLSSDPSASSRSQNLQHKKPKRPVGQTKHQQTRHR